MILNSPKFNLPIFILDLNLTQDIMCEHSCRKINVDIVVLETPAEDFGPRVRHCHHSVAVTKANEEVSKIHK